MKLHILSDLEGTRDNNFNLLRLIAAITVIWSHSLTICGRPEMITPTNTPGLIAVKIFFAISGYLILRSWYHHRSVPKFLVARCARIFPGLWVAVACSVLIGLAVTTLSPKQFLTHPETTHFIVKNCTQLSGYYASLPGVFRSNPYPFGVNSSLWTLQYEMIFYLAAALLGSLNTLATKTTSVRVLTLIFLLGIFFSTFGSVNFSHFLVGTGIYAQIALEFALYFSLGGIGAACSKFIPIHWLLTSVAFAISACLLTNGKWDLWAVPFVTYSAVTLAYLPFGKISRTVNRYGDYSYGLYIHAFPIQQLVMFIFLNTQGESSLRLAKFRPDVWLLFIISLTFTGVAAFLSWHLIEKPALAWNATFWKKRDARRRLTDPALI